MYTLQIYNSAILRLGRGTDPGRTLPCLPIIQSQLVGFFHLGGDPKNIYMISQILPSYRSEIGWRKLAMWTRFVCWRHCDSPKNLICMKYSTSIHIRVGLGFNEAYLLVCIVSATWVRWPITAQWHAAEDIIMHKFCQKWPLHRKD